MNVLLMDFSDSDRDATQQVFYLAEGLQRSDKCSVVLVCAENSQLQADAEKNKIKLRLSGASLLKKTIARLKLRWLIKKSRAGWIIHCNCPESAALGISLTKKNPNLTLAFGIRHPKPCINFDQLDKIPNKRVFICETAEIASILTAEHNINPEDTCIIPGGINISDYPPKIENRDGRFIIGCPGSLISESGHEILIKAMTVLKNTPALPPWEIRITGSGPLFNELLALAHGLGVEKHLAFLGGQPSAVVLPNCDCLIAPASSNTGSSLVIKEGWAIGLPVICSDTPAHKELVTDGLDAICFKNESSEDLGNRLIQLMQQKNLRQKLAIAGKDRLCEYTADKMNGRHLELYSKLMA